MGISKKTDLKLKLLALDIAAREHIHERGLLNLEKVFTQARYIYDRAWQEDFFNWESPWSRKRKDTVVEKATEKKAEEKPKEVVKFKKVLKKDWPKGMKQCPDCGDFVPLGWTEHKFRKDGKECGHTFK